MRPILVTVFMLLGLPQMGIPALMEILVLMAIPELMEHLVQKVLQVLQDPPPIPL